MEALTLCKCILKVCFSIKLRMKLYLIGFMGSGKSSIGKRLAKLLDWKFVDLDECIQKEAAKTIPEIFVDEGEDGFRELERKVLRKSFKLKNAIVATGGGAPCFFDNMAAIREHGMSVYLRCSTDYLRKKLKSSKRERPLVKGKSADELEAYIRQMLQAREDYYLRADHVISWENYSKDQTAKIIAAFIMPKQLIYDI